MGFPAILCALQPFQICIFNRKYRKLMFSNGPQLMGKRFMANVHASLDSKCKSKISKMSMRCQIMGGPFHNFWSWSWKWKFCIDIFMGFPAILSALQTFQIYIFNWKYRKLMFSNGPQLMGKRFMANLHASLDSKCKSRISKISTRCQIWGGPFHNFWSWTWKWKFCIDIFHGVSCNIKHITAISNLQFQ